MSSVSAMNVRAGTIPASQLPSLITECDRMAAHLQSSIANSTSAISKRDLGEKHSQLATVLDRARRFRALLADTRGARLSVAQEQLKIAKEAVTRLPESADKASRGAALAIVSDLESKVHALK